MYIAVGLKFLSVLEHVCLFVRVFEHVWWWCGLEVNIRDMTDHCVCVCVCVFRCRHGGRVFHRPLLRRAHS